MTGEGNRGRATVIDVTQAKDARIQNFLLGGHDHYESDRDAARHLMHLAPNIPQLERVNREFVARAVRYLSMQLGIDQYLDHGCGLPIRDNIHQIARRAGVDARVVYIDNDPVVLAHARMMLDEKRTLVLDADLLDFTTILTRSEQAGMLDPAAPVAALFTSVLHCVPDARNPWRHVAELINQLPSGSVLVLSHLASQNQALNEEVSTVMHELTGQQWAKIRSFAEVERFFDGLRPVGGPIGDVACWHPVTGLNLQSPDRTWRIYGGVARKR
ncbi:SAM-dependent methyltransferase [Streptomyces sp. NPDC056528]|uniref:SAM-dependent methyltransferase n=1 Tax=Streptomyces sp. NPDC056528 TaxID=3345854 RepID=UPI0036B88F81